MHDVTNEITYMSYIKGCHHMILMAIYYFKFLCCTVKLMLDTMLNNTVEITSYIKRPIVSWYIGQSSIDVHYVLVLYNNAIYCAVFMSYAGSDVTIIHTWIDNFIHTDIDSALWSISYHHRRAEMRDSGSESRCTAELSSLARLES